MRNVTIVMTCKIMDEDIGAIFANFGSNYRINIEEETYESLVDGFTKFVWSGAFNDTEESVDDIIRLTHHAEGIYEGTSAEYVHVEVCVDGMWHGKSKSSEQ